MKYIYSVIIIFVFVFTQAHYSPVVYNEVKADSVDSIALKNLELELSKNIETLKIYDATDYDYLISEDSITYFYNKLNEDSLNYIKHLSELKYNLKNILTNPDSIKSQKLFNDYYSKTIQYEIAHIEKVNQEKKKLKDFIYLKDTLKPKRTSLLKKQEEIAVLLNKIITKDNFPNIFTTTYQNSKFKVVIVKKNLYDMSILNNSYGQTKSLEFHYSKNSKSKPVILMNAGMYESDGSPVGLLISNKKEIKGLNSNKNLEGNFYSMPNGVFYIDSVGKYFIKSSTAFDDLYKGKYKNITYGTQSGPVLVIDGKITKNFNIRSTNKLIRNGIGVMKNSKNTISFCVISETPTTFYELASFFKNVLNCDNAMYLDGTVSRLYTYNKVTKKMDKSSNDSQGLGPIFSISLK